MRILVLRGGALGDFIVTLPALSALRQHWPDAQIELVGNTAAAELGVLSGLLDVTHSQSQGRWAQLYRDAPLNQEFGRWLDAFDLIISFWPDPETQLRRHLEPRCPQFLGSDARVTLHPAAAHFCTALQPLGIVYDDYVARLNMPARCTAEASQRLTAVRPTIALHPGSGSPHKNWPQARWQNLVNQLDEPLLMVSGEADLDCGTMPVRSPWVRAHQWPLPILAAALSQCRVFAGHDTGITHLAAAMGLRTIVLFGPTDPRIWAPQGSNVCVIERGHDLSAIDVREVLTRLRAGKSN